LPACRDTLLCPPRHAFLPYLFFTLDRPATQQHRSKPIPTGGAEPSYYSHRNGGHLLRRHRRAARNYPHPHHLLPRLCCPHAVPCDALWYVLLQPKPWDPARACLAGWRAVAGVPNIADRHFRILHVDQADAFLGYSSESCGYCKDASSGRRTVDSRTCMFCLSSFCRHTLSPVHAAMRAVRQLQAHSANLPTLLDVLLRLPPSRAGPRAARDFARCTGCNQSIHPTSEREGFA
jgi:hypothetical protein